jgi:hypothetical protein
MPNHKNEKYPHTLNKSQVEAVSGWGVKQISAGDPRGGVFIWLENGPSAVILCRAESGVKLFWANQSALASGIFPEETSKC